MVSNSIKNSQSSTQSFNSETTTVNSASTGASQSGQASRLSKFHEDQTDFGSGNDPKVVMAPAPARAKLRLPHAKLSKDSLQSATSLALKFLKQSFGYIGLGVAIVVLGAPLLIVAACMYAWEGLAKFGQTGTNGVSATREPDTNLVEHY